MSVSVTYSARTVKVISLLVKVKLSLTKHFHVVKPKG